MVDSISSNPQGTIAPNSPLANGELPLHDAIRRGDAAGVKLLLADPSIDLFQKDDQGLTALNHAFLTHNDETRALLLSHQIKVSYEKTKEMVEDPNFEYTLSTLVKAVKTDSLENLDDLAKAALEGDPKRVKELLDSGVDPSSSKDENGWTALHFAMIHEDFEIAEALIQAGADPMAEDNNGLTPLALKMGCAQTEANTRDPLKLDLFQALLCMGTLIGWAESCCGKGTIPYSDVLSYALILIPVMVAAKRSGSWALAVTGTLATFLQSKIPFLSPVIQVYSACSVGRAAIEGFGKCWRNLKIDTKRSLRNAFVHSVNAASSLQTLNQRVHEVWNATTKFLFTKGYESACVDRLGEKFRFDCKHEALNRWKQVPVVGGLKELQKRKEEETERLGKMASFLVDPLLNPNQTKTFSEARGVADAWIKQRGEFAEWCKSRQRPAEECWKAFHVQDALDNNLQRICLIGKGAPLLCYNEVANQAKQRADYLNNCQGELMNCMVKFNAEIWPHRHFMTGCMEKDQPYFECKGQWKESQKSPETHWNEWIAKTYEKYRPQFLSPTRSWSKLNPQFSRADAFKILGLNPDDPELKKAWETKDIKTLRAFSRKCKKAYFKLYEKHKAALPENKAIRDKLDQALGRACPS